MVCLGRGTLFSSQSRLAVLWSVLSRGYLAERLPLVQISDGKRAVNRFNVLRSC